MQEKPFIGQTLMLIVDIAGMRSKFSAIFFDFDYTLADSSRGAVECINFALKNLGLPAVTDEEAFQTIGLSLPDTFRCLAGKRSDEQHREFISLFIHRADQIMADLTVLFKSVPKTISKLKKQGFTLGIVSTKFHYRIEAILDRESLLHAFDIIIGGEDVSKHKPDPEGLLKAMEKAQSLPSDTLYVGDSLVDAETAKRAGVSFIAMLTGTAVKDSFEGYEVYRFADRFQDLIELKRDQVSD
jgi:phosphoglycolate phosphatase